MTLIKDPVERVDGETERVVESTYIALGKGNECWIVLARGAFAFRFGPYSGPEAGAILNRCVKERIAATVVMQCGPDFDWEIARDIGMKLVLPEDRLTPLGLLRRFLKRLRRSAT
ncbi:hypothetical protein [Bradyrhizobium sp. RT9a]|uniref:hypothetical protein n=1 Tax=Bradyrhizobium sp. RT9a TaxID=3156384 RepID=UPI003393540E